MLDDDVCFLADPTVESMAEAILRALNDEEKRTQVVTRARKLYETKYSRPVYVERMRKLLEVLK